MEISTVIANATATPTTKSTGRDASAPSVGGIRTVLMGLGSTVVTALGGWFWGMFEPTDTGFIIRVDFIATATVIGLAILGGFDYLRRKAADIVVEAKHDAAME